jgi:DNA-binding transcriptional LysR family regulator
MICRNMTEAADKLGISEAAVSKCKSALEHELGVQLFTRLSGRLVPTQEAKALLPYVRRAVNGIQAARDAAATLRKMSVARLNIVCGGPALVHPIPQAVMRLSEAYPEARVEVDVDSLRGLVEKVAYNLADVGVGPVVAHEVDTRVVDMCNIEVVSRDAMVVVFPRNHRLAQASIVRPSDLEGETLVSLNSTSATADMISAILFQSGVQFGRTITAANGVGICALVGAGLGVGFVNINFFHGPMDWNIVARPFSPRIELRTCVYTSKLNQTTAIASRFIQELVYTLRGRSAAVD